MINGLLNTAEVAERLGYSKYYVTHVLIPQNKLRAVKIGGERGHWRVSEAELERFLEEVKRGNAK